MSDVIHSIAQFLRYGSRMNGTLQFLMRYAPGLDGCSACRCVYARRVGEGWLDALLLQEALNTYPCQGAMHYPHLSGSHA